MMHVCLWDSEQFVSLKFQERLLYIALITYADDYGRFKLDPKFWKRRVFHSDRIGPPTIKQMLDRLQEVGLIASQPTLSCTIGYHPNWDRYQKLRSDRAKTSDFPELEGVTGIPNDIPKTSEDKLRKVEVSEEKVSKNKTPKEKMLEGYFSAKGNEIEEIDITTIPF